MGTLKLKEGDLLSQKNYTMLQWVSVEIGIQIYPNYSTDQQVHNSHAW